MTTRVLVCDDQALVRDGFRMILSAEENIDVVGEAGDGVDVLFGGEDHAEAVTHERLVVANKHPCRHCEESGSRAVTR